MRFFPLRDEWSGSLPNAIRPKVIELRQRIIPIVRVMVMPSTCGHSLKRWDKEELTVKVKGPPRRARRRTR